MSYLTCSVNHSVGQLSDSLLFTQPLFHFICVCMCWFPRLPRIKAMTKIYWSLLTVNCGLRICFTSFYNFVADLGHLKSALATYDPWAVGWTALQYGLGLGFLPVEISLPSPKNVFSSPGIGRICWPRFLFRWITPRSSLNALELYCKKKKCFLDYMQILKHGTGFTEFHKIQTTDESAVSNETQESSDWVSSSSKSRHNSCCWNRNPKG